MIPNHCTGILLFNNGSQNISAPLSIAFFFDPITVGFDISSRNWNAFFWDNCVDCFHKNVESCDGGLPTYRQNNCYMRNKDETLKFREHAKIIEREIPSHVFVMTGCTGKSATYFMLAEHNDQLTGLTISNVYLDGRICWGNIGLTHNPIHDYQNFWMARKNTDLISAFKKPNGSEFTPTLEQSILLWEPNIVVDGRFFDFNRRFNVQESRVLDMSIEEDVAVYQNFLLYMQGQSVDVNWFVPGTPVAVNTGIEFDNSLFVVTSTDDADEEICDSCDEYMSHCTCENEEEF
jgi:hypothetical protein